MQREIKFRYYYQHDETGRQHNKTWSLEDVQRGMGIPDCLARYSLFATMQYTGLKDKNEKEVFEGDIVSGFGKLWLISWQVEEARFWIAPWKGNTSTWKFMDEVNRMEVIGNIYENQELVNP